MRSTRPGVRRDARVGRARGVSVVSLASMAWLASRASLTSLASLVAFASLAGCGYTSLHHGTPYGVRRLALVPFGEQQPLGMSPDLAHALALELAACGVELVPSRSDADGVLSGEVTNIMTLPSTVGSGVAAYGVRALVGATLNVGGRVVWTTAQWVADDYQPGSGGLEYSLATEANRREAVRRMAVAAAQQIRTALVLAAAQAPQPTSVTTSTTASAPTTTPTATRIAEPAPTPITAEGDHGSTH